MVDKRKEEFKRSFEKYYPVLCNIAYRYLLDKETSEDIVQDTMLSVWQNKKDLLPESELVPYLKVSIRNNCISFLRKQTFEVLSIADEPVSQKVCSLTEECEEEGVASSEKIEHLLGVLPTKCSLVFRMNKLHGMKYREIAEELNIWPSAGASCIRAWPGYKSPARRKCKLPTIECQRQPKWSQEWM